MTNEEYDPNAQECVACHGFGAKQRRMYPLYSYADEDLMLCVECWLDVQEAHRTERKVP